MSSRYLIEYLRHEDPLDAIARSIETTIKFAEEEKKKAEAKAKELLKANEDALKQADDLAEQNYLKTIKSEITLTSLRKFSFFIFQAPEAAANVPQIFPVSSVPL